MGLPIMRPVTLERDDLEGTARSAGVIRGQRRDEWVAGLLNSDDRAPTTWEL